MVDTAFSTWVPMSPRQLTLPDWAGSHRQAPCLPPQSSSLYSQPWGYSAITVRTVPISPARIRSRMYLAVT